MKHIFKFTLLIMALYLTSCKKDKFAELNTDPSTVATPELRFELTQAMQSMYNDDYLVWFYNNFQYIYPWVQITTRGAGNSDLFVEMGDGGGQNLYSSLVPNIIDLRKKIDALSGTEKDMRKGMRAITYPLLIHPAMTVSDDYGSIIYSQAGIALLTNPPVFTPVYDNQQTQYNLWLLQLDSAIADLTENVPGKIALGSQDLIYGGDYAKWAKFCNLLKLKIAARLINVDRPRALQIAQQVASSPAGYMNSLDDDCIYKRGIRYYGTGNGTQPGSAAKNLVDFLVQNKDPRVRFLFTKNNFNAEVVQQFIDAGKPLPSYVAANVNLDGSGNFASWKAPGEPWVRYYGKPVSPQKTLDAHYADYFQQATRNMITVGSNSKTYSSTSSFSEFLVRTNMNVTFPTKVGGRVIEQRDNYPGLNVIMGSAAETNLYLAEFKLLGANLPLTAQEYFNKGVTFSVQRLDLLAKNNKYPYYETDPVYAGAAAEAGAIKLRAGEIDALLAMPAYNLATNGLEKVYIQQMINFAGTPNDTWTAARRAGTFVTNSTILPREPFLNAAGGVITVPRRFRLGNPTDDNQNVANYKAAIEEQGFTTGTNDPQILNTQRLWFDKQNPNYGAGPKP